MKLFGSTTSPFVRRIRMLLSGRDYEFVNMDIFSAEQRKKLSQDNPAQKVPYLEDDGQFIFDSRVIFNYLSDKFELESLTLEQQNLLTLIDAATDSLVQLLLLNRSGINTEEDKMYFSLQRGRLREIFASLETKVQQDQFSSWHYPAICLFCTIDWLMFRELYDLSAYPELTQFWQQLKHQSIAVETDPRS
jgi:glutathione S-transferase